MLAVGSQAPGFSLPDQDGNTYSLESFRDQWVIVYFYPKDDTPGCTKEACSFRDMFHELKQHGIQVIGISKDNVNSHKKFVEKFQLPFLLLSDTEKTTIQAYGAWGVKKFMGREFDGILRNTYLIDPEGKIAKIYEKVKPDEHAQEILKDWEQLSAHV